jgi:hypothetical protein
MHSLERDEACLGTDAEHSRVIELMNFGSQHAFIPA